MYIITVPLTQVEIFWCFFSICHLYRYIFGIMSYVICLVAAIAVRETCTLSTGAGPHTLSGVDGNLCIYRERGMGGRERERGRRVGVSNKKNEERAEKIILFLSR